MCHTMLLVDDHASAGNERRGHLIHSARLQGQGRVPPKPAATPVAASARPKMAEVDVDNLMALIVTINKTSTVCDVMELDDFCL